MTGEEIVEHLTELCGKLGLAVRFESMASSGGLCNLRGAKTLFVGTACSRAEQTVTFCEALIDMDLDEVYILPEIREIIESQFSRIRAERQRQNTRRE